jgi:hypothetical protein
MKKNTWAVIISVVAAVAIFVVAYVSSVSLLGAAWIVVGGLLTASVAAIAILAGVVVIKSLFLITAELSFLVFLSQAYCATPAHSAYGDDALRSLIFLGLIYIAFAFVQSLYAAIKERYTKIGTRGSWNIRTIILTAVFLIFTCLFLFEIYLVIQPIFASLCVFG